MKPSDIFGKFSSEDQITILQATLTGLDNIELLDILDVADEEADRIQSKLRTLMRDEASGNEVRRDCCQLCSKPLEWKDIEGGRCTDCGHMIVSESA